MTDLRFIHSSDLHLGRRFLNIPEPPDGNLRGRLMEARFEQIQGLAKAARAHGAEHVLLAGDTFDSATPSQQVLRQALAAMRDESDVTWWLLPGNHDNLHNAEPVWETIRTDTPANIRAVTTDMPIALEPDAMLLPCPVPVRSAGRDLTSRLPQHQTSDGTLRIGFAHGGVVDFSQTGDQIPPDRDRTAGLDYLALGDWHGRLAISDRTHYSGTPEQDQFKHGVRGRCLAVHIAGRGAHPEITEVETGNFLWHAADLTLHDGEDAAAAFETLLPGTDRRNTLFWVAVYGWATLSERAALQRSAEVQAPDFAYLDLQSDTLGTLHSAADLDEIDHAGAMRVAAAELMEEAENMGLADEDRSIATAALNRLYAYAKDASE